jgi:hypothetical protein
MLVQPSRWSRVIFSEPETVYERGIFEGETRL